MDLKNWLGSQLVTNGAVFPDEPTAKAWMTSRLGDDPFGGAVTIAKPDAPAPGGIQMRAGQPRKRPGKFQIPKSLLDQCAAMSKKLATGDVMYGDLDPRAKPRPIGQTV